MVKVLENKIIDLDLLPGQAQIDLQREFRQQLDGKKTITAGEVARVIGQKGGDEGGRAEGGKVQIPGEMVPDEVSGEEEKKEKGVAGAVVDGGGKVVGGLAGTVGGVLKGVGDTGANVVYDVGSGLGGIGTGLAGGLKDTATAPFSGNDKQKPAGTPEMAKAQENQDTKKAGPRKIEIRSEKDKA
ncbi:hypothetical protein FKW77_003557 [Venturia effusa]|uniref:Uncharacterized protein n=1 Tax=Venturia effusa TaxID=50376 RepID=A0A517LF63_9PEZI|nr:hypothetical protein FKW77_003557 [Venturia effusa]